MFPFRFGSCILPSLLDTIKRLKYTIIYTLIWWIYVFIWGGFPPLFLAEHLCRVIIDPKVHAVCFHDRVVFMNLGDNRLPLPSNSSQCHVVFLPFFHVLQSAILLSSFAFCSCILPSLPCDSKAIKRHIINDLHPSCLVHI